MAGYGEQGHNAADVFGGTSHSRQHKDPAKLALGEPDLSMSSEERDRLYLLSKQKQAAHDAMRAELLERGYLHPDARRKIDEQLEQLKQDAELKDDDGKPTREAMKATDTLKNKFIDWMGTDGNDKCGAKSANAQAYLQSDERKAKKKERAQSDERKAKKKEYDEARNNDPEHKASKKEYDEARNNDPEHKASKKEYDETRNYNPAKAVVATDRKCGVCQNKRVANWNKVNYKKKDEWWCGVCCGLAREIQEETSQPATKAAIKERRRA